VADSISRKTVMQIGIVVSTFFTLLIPPTQTGAQLIIIRVLTGIGLGFVFSAPFPTVRARVAQVNSVPGLDSRDHLKVVEGRRRTPSVAAGVYSEHTGLRQRR
jgi:MFS family permease